MASESRTRETSPFTRQILGLLRLLYGGPTAEPQQNETDLLTPSEVLDLLASSRRRAVLEELAGTEGGRIALGVLTEAVAADEYDCEPDEVSSDQRNRIYVALTQSHLHRLDDASVVTRTNRTVARGPAFDHVWTAYIAFLEANPPHGSTR